VLQSYNHATIDTNRLGIENILYDYYIAVIKTLLSLIPPSCIVVPIRELVNIQTLTSASNTKPTQMAFIPANVAMDVNNDFIRGML